MDMDEDDMGSMSGLDMGGEGPFRHTNERLAHGFWYGIAAIVGLLAILRVVDYLQRRDRQTLHHKKPECIPSRPRGPFSQAYATATATMRELCYPQPIYFVGRYSRYFSPLPIGRWLVLIVYWIVLLCFLWSNTILQPSSPM